MYIFDKKNFRIFKDLFKIIKSTNNFNEPSKLEKEIIQIKGFKSNKE